MSGSVDAQTLLRIATEAASRSATYLTDAWKRAHDEEEDFDLQIETKSSDIDYVTEADGKAQEVIIETIQENFPDHRFIAEEEGADTLGSPDSPFEWIIDPLDGTTNFIHGKPNFGSIVALQKDGELIIGVMHLPLMNLTYSCAKGEGVLVNGNETKLRNTKGLSDAVLSSNTIRRAKKDENGVYQISSPHCASLENCGCAATEIGEVILGQSDGVFFRGIKLWDIAAGFLMISELGGKYRYEYIEEGDKRGGLLAVASTEPIFDELCEFVFEKRFA